MSELKTVKILCSACSKRYEIELDVQEFGKFSSKGIVTVAVNPPCGHIGQVFIDKKFKYRGSQVTDIVLDEAKISTIESDNNVSSPGGEKASLSLKAAFEIILLNAKDYYSIKAISADIKVDASELALIEGDLQTARDVFDDLEDFSRDIGDEDLARSLKSRIEKIDFMLKASELDASPLSFTTSEMLERIDDIIIDLKFHSVKGEISEQIFKAKKKRLEVLRKCFESDESCEESM
ncbi:MAG: hypothetical protein ACTSUE_01575 [Promethearchaeota archaeon]